MLAHVFSPRSQLPRVAFGSNFGKTLDQIVAGLFANGEVGTWFDPSDMSTLFQDAAGTTPVTAVEQPVSLMLDKSKGLVLGSEAAVNGTFDTDTNWLKGTGVSIAGGGANFTAVAIGAGISQTAAITFDTSKFYQVRVTISGHSSGNITVRCGSGGAFNAIASGNGTFTVIVLGGANNTTLQFFTSTGNATYILDNISVKEIAGNHAYTPSTASTSRPTLSARYNLLTYSEQFDNAAWVAGVGCTKVGLVSGVGPNGEAAMEISWVDATSQALNQASTQTTLTYTLKAYVRAKTGTANIRLRNGANSISSDFTLTTSWQVVEYTSTNTGGTSSNIFPGSTNVGNIYILWADLRVSNDGVNIPDYQRVGNGSAGSSDYDTVGFPPYLRFDGSDDYMLTNSIDFTGTDKMTVFAGVRKLSDAAAAILAELSVSAGSNSGTWLVTGPNSTTERYAFASRGSGVSLNINQVADTTSNTYLSPVSNVLTGIGNISGDSNILRINGTQLEEATGDQGSGNYGNYPIYIGRRGGTTLPFNGRLYGLITRGAETNSSALEAAERFMNQRTGAY